jgi:RES domain-containing protein
MIQGFRICRKEWAKSAFDGEGARQYGGRWNNPGTRMVYLAGSVSLAQLEVLVHLESEEILAGQYVVIPVLIPRRLIQVLDTKGMPKNWRQPSPPAGTRRIGDEWVSAAKRPVLQVPSVIVPQESNFLVNPAHPAFPDLVIGKAEDLSFDPRLA